MVACKLAIVGVATIVGVDGFARMRLEVDITTEVVETVVGGLSTTCLLAFKKTPCFASQQFGNRSQQ